MKKQMMILTVIVVGILGMGLSAWAQGARGALTVLEGQEGKQAIQKVIAQNPAAKAFVAEVLGVEVSRVTAMAPEVLQKLLVQRLEGQGSDQVALRQRALEFFETSLTSRLDQNDLSADKGGIVDKEIMEFESSNAIDVSVFTRTAHELEAPLQALIEEGALMPSEAGAAQAAILTTDIEGSDVNRCLTTWKKPENKALLARTYVAGANALEQGGGRAALKAISNEIVRARGVSYLEAQRRACALAGADPAVRCNVYGQPVLEACLN